MVPPSPVSHASPATQPKTPATKEKPKEAETESEKTPIVIVLPKNATPKKPPDILEDRKLWEDIVKDNRNPVN